MKQFKQVHSSITNLLPSVGEGKLYPGFAWTDTGHGAEGLG